MHFQVSLLANLGGCNCGCNYDLKNESNGRTFNCSVYKTYKKKVTGRERKVLANTIYIYREIYSAPAALKSAKSLTTCSGTGGGVGK